MDQERADIAAELAMSQRGDADDVFAPDTSEIRLRVSTSRGSMVYGALPAGWVSLAIAHRTVDEVWYITAGRGTGLARNPVTLTRQCAPGKPLLTTARHQPDSARG